MSFTEQWAQNQFRRARHDNCRDLFVFVVDDNTHAIVSDDGLSLRGWTQPATAVLPACVDPGRGYFLVSDNPNWNALWERISVVSLEAKPSALKLLQEMYAEGTRQASTQSLTSTLDSLFGMIARSDFAEINALFNSADLALLAPEFLVGVPRITYRWKGRIRSWTPFLMAAERELRSRGGFDVDELFAGINDTANAAV